MKFLNTLIFFFIYTVIIAQNQLLMIGGGDRTPDVLAKIIETHAKDKPNILIVPWASGEPEESYQFIKSQLAAISDIPIICAPFAPLDAEKKAKLMQQLSQAGGVFFCGGDQNRIMEVLKDEEIYAKMHQLYNQNIAFSGTSAGTAIMSEVMITGEGDFKVIDANKVETKKGLGLMKNLIVDQHFIKRQRQNRLIGLIFKYPQLLGVGIDEDTAFFVKDNRFAEVLGDSQVMIFEIGKHSDEMKFVMLRKGEKYDLKKHKKR